MIRLLLTLTLTLTLSAAIAGAGDSPASMVDQLLRTAWQEQSIQPAPLCSDEQFLRRLTLDLVGRIPTIDERQTFLADPDRAAAIDRLLASEEFPRSWAEIWTTQLYGYEDDSSDRDLLTQWLEQQIRSGQAYDRITQQLVSSSGQSAFDGPVNFLLRYPDEPVVKVSRAFLGVRLDCARCHDHPFDRWTQDDFKKMNRFFDGMERQEVSSGNVRLSDVVRDDVPSERPRFLTGAEPKTNQWRAEFGLFLIRSRPFARNFANRTWYHLLGRGIVHPVDDVSRDNPASLPAVLEWLADEAIRSQFDIRHMLQLICNSQAYQFRSIARRGDEERIRLFAVRSIKPLTPEQWYASMCVSMGTAPKSEERMEFVRTFYGDALDGDFSSSWEYRETVQGLMSRLVETVAPPTSKPDDLFVRILGREPTSEERTFCQGRTAREVCFVLLHSSEFAFNH